MDSVSLGLVAIIVFVLLVGPIWCAGEWIVEQILDYRRARMALVEAELDCKQAELRGVFLGRAEQLAASAHETRKAMIRESFLASGGAKEPRGASKR